MQISLRNLVKLVYISVPILILSLFLATFILLGLFNIAEIKTQILYIINDNATYKSNLDLIILKSIGLVALFYIIFVLSSVISGLITYNSYKITAYYSSGNENITLDNNTGLEDIIFRSLKWNFYKLKYILTPILIFIGIILFLIMINLIFFNWIITFAAISTSLTIFIVSFLSIILGIGLLISIIMTCSNTLNTLFGMECTISNPDLTNQTVKNRCKKLAFIKPINLLVSIFYLFFIFIILSQFVIIILFKDFISQDNCKIILAMFSLDIILFLGFKYFKSLLYLDSLIYKYRKITFNPNNFAIS